MKNLAVMVSGGIDSFIAYRKTKQDVFEDVLPIFINLGQPYAAKELKICKKLYGEELIVVNSDLVHLQNEPGLLNPEIFGRNTLIAFYGAVMADEVWISALETETTKFTVRDKQPEFFHLCSALFSFVFKERTKEIIVRTPFANLSKTELIRLALDIEWVTENELMETVSCYDEKEQNCGRCVTCFKRWVAMTNNNIYEIYKEHPCINEYARITIDNMITELKGKKLSGKYTMKRIEETKMAIKTANIWMPELDGVIE